MFFSNSSEDSQSEDLPFDESKPLSRWTTNDFLAFLRHVEKTLNYRFSQSTFSTLKQESWDGSALVEFQVSDLENLISRDEAELIFSSIQKHISYQKKMNEIQDKLENIEMGEVLTSRVSVVNSNQVSNTNLPAGNVGIKPERKDSIIITKKSVSSENLEKTRFGNRTGIVITRRDSSMVRPNSNNQTSTENPPTGETVSTTTLHSPNSPQLTQGNQSPFSSSSSTPTTPNDTSPIGYRPPKPLGYTTRKSMALNGSIIPIINNNTSTSAGAGAFGSTTEEADTNSTSSSDSNSMLRPSLDSNESNNMMESMLNSSPSTSTSNSKEKKKGRSRLVSCLVNSDLDNCVRPIDEKTLRQTNFPQILNNDLTLIEQLGKYKSRYKNIYLLLTDPSSFDTIIQKKMNSNGKKKKLFDVKFDVNSTSDASSQQQTNNIEKMFPESEQTHATTSNIVIDFVSVQLSERLPLLIDFKQLNELERVLVSNVFKKLTPIDRRIFSHREKIFMSENLALPDCYNYLFFDNPTGEKSGTILLNDGEESEPEKKSNLASKLFGRSSKKEEAYLQCQLVVFEFSESFMIEMKDTNMYKLFRTGLMIGNWFLEWKENSLVIPSRKPPQGLLRFNPHFHYIPLKKIEGEKNITALLSKLSEVCSLWNGTNVYNLKTCNHQHFVQDVIKALELVPLTKVDDKKRGQSHHVLQYPFGMGVQKLLNRVERYGFSDMAFYLNQPVKEALFGKKMAMELQKHGVEQIVSGEAYSRLGENEKTLVGNIEYAPESIRNKYTYKNLQQKSSNSDEVPEDKNFIVFSSHAELDKVYFDLDSKIGSASEGKDYFKTTNDGKWDLWLLKLYDRCFWIRLGTLKEGKRIFNSKDAPLSNLPESSMNISNNGSFGPCLCPFNTSGVGITEFDMQLMMLNPTSSTAFLADHEPPIPDRIWLPYQL